jgi:hypothetical protein
MVFWIPEFAEDLVFQGGCNYNLTREKFRNQKKTSESQVLGTKSEKKYAKFWKGKLENFKFNAHLHIHLQT